MQIILCAVGRLKAGPERTLFEHYLKRIPWTFDVVEVAERRKVPTPELRRLEAEQLLEKVPDGAKLIVLDERGKDLDSRALAQKLGAWQDGGCRQTAFIIGGADGVDESLRKKADLVLSFGRLTWPHMLVRALVAEQIYRAYAILSGHPYHRD
ncbi:MAG: 23S rRNA (pseudouridine(1915)-N(3))-methyltransferase RlmH [Rhodospirillales bacterium]|nr:23S rRNA (pseudouridine(1915)-N(3))-methyltransferase RlmH [Rhodospirillales bacterium]